MGLVFDRFAATTVELGKMEREGDFLTLTMCIAGVKANESEDMVQRERKPHR